ncbi:MAG: hypothetical protein L5656_04530 [Thermanaeromonas sp.]|uniref:hypothetical protein n=1 Tax=Thermanaeromonas sp. TaxID=2003697 RepID=UPI0024405A25|nr:hypothetical protein [Thermanaeromonas sp.]MCG0277780.1 hypothetical protein [Thermanaeromonas sp.]
MKAIPIRACVGGRWAIAGKLIPGDPAIFEQRIKPGDILRIEGAAGIDLVYDPPLPENTVIRHITAVATFEIPLAVLKTHPKTRIRQVGSLHPKRMYLPYRYWRNVNEEQEQLTFAWVGEASV